MCSECGGLPAHHLVDIADHGHLGDVGPQEQTWQGSGHRQCSSLRLFEDKQKMKFSLNLKMRMLVQNKFFPRRYLLSAYQVHARDGNVSVAIV